MCKIIVEVLSLGNLIHTGLIGLDSRVGFCLENIIWLLLLKLFVASYLLKRECLISHEVGFSESIRQILVKFIR